MLFDVVTPRLRSDLVTVTVPGSVGQLSLNPEIPAFSTVF